MIITDIKIINNILEYFLFIDYINLIRFILKNKI